MSNLSYEQDIKNLKNYCDAFAEQSGIKFACLLEENGQVIVFSDKTDFDMTSLASLIAGSVAATGGMARLLGEKAGFKILFHEGLEDQLLINTLDDGSILVILFDHSRTLGWVRFQVRKVQNELSAKLKSFLGKYTGSNISASPFAEIKDDEIDALF